MVRTGSLLHVPRLRHQHRLQLGAWARSNCASARMSGCLHFRKHSENRQRARRRCPERLLRGARRSSSEVGSGHSVLGACRRIQLSRSTSPVPQQGIRHLSGSERRSEAQPPFRSTARKQDRYQDEQTPDGVLTAIKGTDPENHFNRWLRSAHFLHVPIVYFVGTAELVPTDLPDVSWSRMSP